MPSPSLKVDDMIDARCTQCRKVRPHRILTLSGAAADKVECSHCGRERKYRPPTPKKARAAATAAQSKETQSRQWVALRDELESASAVDYLMTRTYRANAVIRHPSFGLGMVQRIVGNRKIEVLFETGLKTMRCA